MHLNIDVQSCAWYNCMGGYSASGRYYVVTSCFNCEYRHGKVEQREIFASYCKELREDAIVLADPLSAWREMRELGSFEERLEGRARARSFLRQFPMCASDQFSGGLLLRGKDMFSGIAALTELAEAFRSREHFFVLKKNHVLAWVCDGGSHVFCKEEGQALLFKNLLKRRLPCREGEPNFGVCDLPIDTAVEVPPSRK